jgi:F-type H+-transporting ATPase subunit epsilon
VPIELTIVTPQGEAYRGPVERVVLPGSEGDFGVLSGHERFLTALRIGEVEIRSREQMLFAAIADGFVEVTGDEVVVLVESCELDREIDVARAEHARERAEQGLAQLGVDEDELRYRDYEAALKRAQTRIAVSQRSPD